MRPIIALMLTLAAPALAADPDVTEAIAFHCGWQLGNSLMQSEDIQEFPKCKEIRLRANLIGKTQEEINKEFPEHHAFVCGVKIGINLMIYSSPNANDCERIYRRASNVLGTIPSEAFHQ